MSHRDVHRHHEMVTIGGKLHKLQPVNETTKAILTPHGVAHQTEMVRYTEIPVKWMRAEVNAV